MINNVNIPKHRYEMMANRWSDLFKNNMNVVIDVPNIIPNKRNIDITNAITPFLFFIFLVLV